MPIQKGTYKAGLYCRLSNDDSNKETTDSSSIYTQKLLLKEYCEKENFIIYDYYIDEGFSGLNFDRPEFIRMLNDIDNKKINLVITKDLSRLGRNYIETGYYIEKYFADKNIRYIAVNDNIDSLNSENDITPFKNILNELYAKDLSRKVKTAKHQRAMEGMFIASQTPYGYRKNPGNPNQLIIDEEAAEVVKIIFDLYHKGNGYIKISNYLKENKIITPAVYKVKNGDTRFIKMVHADEYDWRTQTIRHILKNIVYTGTMENRKTEVMNYKTKKIKKIPKEERIVVENTHEEIISKVDFDKVQNLINSKQGAKRLDNENLFKGLLICKNCGHRMHYIAIPRYLKDGTEIRDAFYKCPYPYWYKDICPRYNGISYKNFKDIVTKRIRYLFKKLKDDKKLFSLINNEFSKNSNIEKYRRIQIKTEKELEQIIQKTSKLYSDYVMGVISDNDYEKLLQKYQKEQKELKEQLEDLKKLLIDNKDINNNFKKLKDAAKGYSDFNE